MSKQSIPAVEIPIRGSERIRPRFVGGQVLRAADLAAEQDAQAEVHERHLLECHGAGVVSGLELQQHGDDLVLTAGVAIDAQGREIVLAESVPLVQRIEDQFGRARVEVSVAVAYGRQEVLAKGYTPHAARWQESAVLRLSRAIAESSDSPADPAGAHAPHADASVFVGRLARDAEPSSGWRVVGLPGAGQVLQADEILSSDKTVRLALGVQKTPEELVANPGEGNWHDCMSLTAKDGLGQWHQRMALNARGVLSVNTELHVKQTLTSGAWRFDELSSRADIAKDTYCLWREESGMRLALPEIDSASFVVGATDAEGEFVPVLEVTKKGITVHGNLTVDGAIKDETGQLAPIAQSDGTPPKKGKLAKIADVVAKVWPMLLPLLMIVAAAIIIDRVVPDTDAEADALRQLQQKEVKALQQLHQKEANALQQKIEKLQQTIDDLVKRLSKKEQDGR